MTNAQSPHSAPLNPFLPDAPVRKTFTDEGVCVALERWAADERERQSWGDRDRAVYKHRADLLEAAAVRLRAASNAKTSKSDEAS